MFVPSSLVPSSTCLAGVTTFTTTTSNSQYTERVCSNLHAAYKVEHRSQMRCHGDAHCWMAWCIRLPRWIQRLTPQENSVSSEGSVCSCLLIHEAQPSTAQPSPAQAQPSPAQPSTAQHSTAHIMQTRQGARPGVKVVDAKGNIQGHLAAQALPPHGFWVITQGTVQVPSLQQQPPTL